MDTDKNGVTRKTDREWIRLRKAYGATGYELTRMGRRGER